jgi:hypothetical protein
MATIYQTAKNRLNSVAPVKKTKYEDYTMYILAAMLLVLLLVKV